jgi:hypothetical protein
VKLDRLTRSIRDLALLMERYFQRSRCPFQKFAASQAAVRLYGLGG